MTMDYCEHFSSMYPEHWQQTASFCAGTTRDLPQLLHLEIHPIPPAECFNRCIYCAGGRTSPPRDAGILPLETMIAAVEDATALGAKMIVVASNSGDPARAPHLGAFFEYLKQKEDKIKWGLHTCGRDLDKFVGSLTLTTEDRSYISVGLDAVHEEVYQRTKLPRPDCSGHESACERVVEDLKAICATKVSKRSGPTISLSCQLTRHNCGRGALRDFLDFAYDTPGINRVRFSIPFPPTRATRESPKAFVSRVCPERDELPEVIRMIKDHCEARRRQPAANVGVKITLPVIKPKPINKRRYRHCANQLLFAVLGPDSYVYPCTTVTATCLERRLFRFTQEGDLIEYWHSEARRSQLWFDVGEECAGFNCSNCEHAVNTALDLDGASRATQQATVYAPYSESSSHAPRRSRVAAEASPSARG